MKQAVIGLMLLILLPGNLLSQVKSTFSGDPSKYKAELTAFMGPNLNDVQKANLNSFLVKWDSAAFNDENKYRIIDLTSMFYGRAMRPVPHFNDLLAASTYSARLYRPRPLAAQAAHLVRPNRIAGFRYYFGA